MLAKTPADRYTTATQFAEAITLTSARATEQLAPRAKPASGKIMLVVLPFENMSGDPEQEYFCDGMTEEMISQLVILNPKQ